MLGSLSFGITGELWLNLWCSRFVVTVSSGFARFA